MIVLLVSIIICIVLVGFYSGAETAFISVNRMKLRHQAESGHKAAIKALSLLEDMDRLLATTLIGTNIFVVTASGLFVLLVSNLIEHPKEWVITAILTPIILIFGEIFPKTFFRQKADESIFMLEKPIVFSAKVFAPVITVTTFISQYILGTKKHKEKRRKSPFVSREELKYLVRESEKEGVVEPQERLLIYSIFDFGGIKVSQAMVDLNKAVLLPDSATGTDVRALVKKTHFSRFPIYHKTKENIIGIINVLDILYESKEIDSLIPYIRPAAYLESNMPVDDALIKLQSRKQPMAIVNDGHKKNIGIITVEDIVEEIVGEI